MAVSRRTLLLGALSAAGAMALVGCRVPVPGAARPTAPGMPTTPTPSAEAGGATLSVPADIRQQLEALVLMTGIDAFQRLVISDHSVIATLRPPAGGETSYARVRTETDWSMLSARGPSVSDSPTPRPLVDLPIDRLADYAAFVAADDALRVLVDHAGFIRVVALQSPDDLGIEVDASGFVDPIDVDTPDGVRQALDEIVADYGTAVVELGSFNGFVFVDGNVGDVGIGLRTIRSPSEAPAAVAIDVARFADERLFDPTGFDPTAALSRRSTIADESGVEGRVFSWRWSRPPQGGEPLLSFGIGLTAPTSRV